MEKTYIHIFSFSSLTTIRFFKKVRKKHYKEKKNFFFLLSTGGKKKKLLNGKQIFLNKMFVLKNEKFIEK
jgi:hypothetical protein